MEGEGKKRLAKLGALDLNTTFTNVNNDGTDDDSKQDDEISDGRKSLDKKPDGNKESGVGWSRTCCSISMEILLIYIVKDWKEHLSSYGEGPISMKTL